MLVYKIDTNLSKLEGEKIIDTLTNVEFKILKDYNLIAYDQEIDGKLTSFVIAPSHIMTNIFLFLRKKEISFKYENITNKVLLGDIDFKNTKFENDINNFIKNNITIDIVLDKINSKGMKSLSSLDKEVLNKVG